MSNWTEPVVSGSTDSVGGNIHSDFHTYLPGHLHGHIYLDIYLDMTRIQMVYSYLGANKSHIRHRWMHLMLEYWQNCTSIAKINQLYKPRFLVSGTLIFSHNSPNMTYFVKHLVCVCVLWCPDSTYNFRTIGLQLQILSYTAHGKHQQSFIIVAMGALSQKFTIGEIG